MLLSPVALPGGGGTALQGGQVAPYSPAGQPLMAGHGRVLTALPPVQLAAGNATTHAKALEVVRGARCQRYLDCCSCWAALHWRIGVAGLLADVVSIVQLLMVHRLGTNEVTCCCNHLQACSTT